MSVSRKSTSQRKTGRKVLPVIAALLLGSALLRAAIGASEAIAEDRIHQTSNLAEPTACETPAELENLVAALQSREERLEEREKQMRARLQALAVADQEIEAKLVRLANAEERLRGTLALADTAAEDDIARLVSVYEVMKPKEAATLFEEMSPEFAAGFLGRMRPEAAAGILAGLTPQAAYSLSVILAGRNAAVPKE